MTGPARSIPTKELVSVRIADRPVTSTAPNGSTTSEDWYSTEVYRQTWPEDGSTYSGKVYKITKTYISPTRPRTAMSLGQCISVSSDVWDREV